MTARRAHRQHVASRSCRGRGCWSWISLRRSNCREIVGMGPFPGLIVGLAPQPPVIGRTRIGVERHGVVGPDTAGPQTIAPFRHEPGVVARDFEEVRLDERHGPAGVDQPFGEVFGRHAAALVERCTALDGETLDAGFDRDAARRSQEVEHVGLPEIDAGLDAEFDGAGHQRFEQRPLRQEDLVDEVDVSDALGHEAVDLGQQQVRGRASGICRESRSWRRTSNGTGNPGRPRLRPRGRRGRGRSGGGDAGAGRSRLRSHRSGGASVKRQAAGSPVTTMRSRSR